MMNNALYDIVNYYLDCLSKEQREDIVLWKNELSKHTVPVCIASNWNETLSDKSLLDELACYEIKENTIFLVTSHLWVGNRRKYEPLIGLFCEKHKNVIQPDFNDIWINPVLTEEIEDSKFVEITAKITNACLHSPEAYAQAVEIIIKEELELSSKVCSTLDEVIETETRSAVKYPVLWVMETSSIYDRGLRKELETLKSAPNINIFHTALGSLFFPPQTVDVDDSDFVTALANPGQLTFSQSKALAYASKQPLTVITGPPGTGKTRVIASLIIEHLIQSKSILVASRINTAVDTAVELCERLVGKGIILRTGNETNRTELAETALRLSGCNQWQCDGELFSNLTQTESYDILLNQKIKLLTKNVNRIRNASKKLQQDGQTPLKWWQWIRKYRLKSFENGWKEALEQSDSLFELLPKIRNRRISDLRMSLDFLLQRSKQSLNKLSSALTGGKASRHRHFGNLIKYGFPVAVTNLSVSTNIPLEPALFNTLVIDEASTCDPASLIPLLYRAERVVIVGDPQQLPHITGNGWKQAQPVPKILGFGGIKIDAEFGSSTFHLMSEIAPPCCRQFLSDHFRCPPAIISFSNEAFYGGALRINTPDTEKPVTLIPVAGDSVSARNGSRHNPSQLAVALETLTALIKKHPGETVGLCSPYRASIDYALDAIEANKDMNELYLSEKLIVGTAHRFQGNEVNHLVFMTVAGDNAKDREIKWMEHPQLFNVAVTRAKKSLYMIVSKKLWDNGCLTLTKKLMNSSSIALRTRHDISDELINTITSKLQPVKLKTLTNYSFRGYTLDIMDNNLPPSWAINVLTWDELSELSSQQILERWSEDQSLQKWDVKIIHVNPLNWEKVIDRWIASRELSNIR